MVRILSDEDYEKLVFLLGKVQGYSSFVLEEYEIKENEKFIKHILSQLKADMKNEN